MKKRICALVFAIFIPIMLFVACGGTSEAEVEMGPAHGVWNGNVYINEYLGLEFTMPDNWLMMTAEELARIVGTSTSIDEMIEGEVIHDMMAFGGADVEISFERFSEGSAMDYLEAEANRLKEITMGNADLIFADRTTRIGARDYYLLTYTLQIGNNASVRHYFVNGQGEYMSIITINLGSNYALEDILAMFN